MYLSAYPAELIVDFNSQIHTRFPLDLYMARRVSAQRKDGFWHSDACECHMTCLFSCGLMYCSLGYMPTETVLDTNFQLFQNVLVQVGFIRNRSFRQRVLCVQVSIEVMRFRFCSLHNRQPPRANEIILRYQI